MSVRSSPQPIAEQVRLAWEAGGTPDLASLLAANASAGEAERVDGLVEDSEQRWDRGLAGTLEHYLAVVPREAERAEAARAILMLEFSRRASEEFEKVRADVLARLPRFSGEVGAVAEMVELMRSLGAGSEAEALEAGVELGKYRLVEWLGAGSYGEVWSAWDSTLERYVALKLLPGDSADGSHFASVLSEAKSAACIDHENVVKVHDAGRFESPPPERCFIDTQLVGDPAPTAEDAKRVVAGRSLATMVTDEFADRGLPVREAVRLIEAVCRGAAAAHARGIVHRDIKPSNVLVTGSGRPLLSDFGLSLLGAPEGHDGAEAPERGVREGATGGQSTRGRITGTPAFMAPEQAYGEPATPASDIYALGATLRYALTGKLPFQPSGRYAPDAAWDVIEQVRRREFEPLFALRPDLPKDVAAICEKAMVAEPEGRYLSAEAMAADLRAFLEGRPVGARPAGGVRKASMWAARNKAVVGLAVVMVVLGGAGLWRYVVNIGRERDRAVAAEVETQKQLKQTELARASAQSVNDFLQGILSAADPQVLGKNATVLDAVRLTTPDIERRFGNQPLVEADVRETVGQVFGAFGEIDEARKHLERTLELRRALLGEQAPETFAVRHVLAKIAEDQIHQGETGDAIESLVEEMRRVLGPEHRVTLAAELTLADAYASRHRLEEALALTTAVVEKRRKIGDGDSIATMAAEQIRAALMCYSERGEEGIRLLYELIEREGRLLGPNHFQRYLAMIDLGFSLKFMNREEEAVLVYTQALNGLRTQLPKGHEQTLTLARGLASLLSQRLGRAQEGLDILLPEFEAYMEKPDHAPFQVASCHDILGVCYLRLHRYPEAERELLIAREGYIQMMENSTNDTVRAIDRFLAETYEGLGMTEKACEFRELGRRRVGPAKPPSR